MLKGKKSYLVAIAIAIVNSLGAMGIITPETVGHITGLLLGVGVATLRSGINDVEEKAEEVAEAVADVEAGPAGPIGPAGPRGTRGHVG